MKKINIKKETLINILEYFLVFFIILESNSIFSQIYGFHTIIRIALVVLSIGCLTGLLLLRKARVNKGFLKFLLFDLLISSIMIFNTNNITGIGIIFLVLFMFPSLLYLYFQNIDRKKINNMLIKFVNIVLVLCCISLIFYFLSSVLGIIKPTGIIKVLWGKPYSEIETYCFLHFNTQTIYWITGSPIVRNTGIYTEGPMYALIILLALIFNTLTLPTNKKNNYIKSIIFVVTMITTFSVTGLICSLIVISNYGIEFIKKSSKRNKKVFTYLIVAFFLLLLPFSVDLLGKKLETSSSSHRMMDIVNGFNAFIEDPIIGKGINHERLDELNAEEGYGYSNAIIPVMTDGGIILLVSYMFSSILLLIHSIKNKKINYLLFLIVFYILLFTTLFQYRLTMILLLLLQYFIYKKEFVMTKEE